MRVQPGMEEEEDAEEQDCMYTVSVRSGFFQWKPASWLLFMSRWQAKTSVLIIGLRIPKSRAQVVDSSFEWTDDFYERLQIILKHFLEFKNGPCYLYGHSQCVLVFFPKWRFIWRHLFAGPKILLTQPAWNQKKGCRKKTSSQKGN